MWWGAATCWRSGARLRWGTGGVFASRYGVVKVLAARGDAAWVERIYHNRGGMASGAGWDGGTGGRADTSGAEEPAVQTAPGGRAAAKSTFVDWREEERRGRPVVGGGAVMTDGQSVARGTRAGQGQDSAPSRRNAARTISASGDWTCSKRRSASRKWAMAAGMSPR